MSRNTHETQADGQVVVGDTNPGRPSLNTGKRSQSRESDNAEASEVVSPLPGGKRSQIAAILDSQNKNELRKSGIRDSKNRLIESIMSSGSQSRSLTRSFQEIEQAKNNEKVLRRKSSGVNYFN